MARQVRAMRTAISPRLAIRTFFSTSGNPAGLALLEERAHPLLRLVGHPDVGDALDGIALHVLDAPPRHLADERLGLGDGARARLQQLLDAAVDRRVEVFL